MLTALPSTANFTALTIANNAAATQSRVTRLRNGYLTLLPSTANSATLTIAKNAVATQSWVIGNGYLTALPNL